MRRARKIRSHAPVRNRQDWRRHYAVPGGPVPGANESGNPAAPPPFAFADPSVFSLPYLHGPLPHRDSPAAMTVTLIEVREVDYFDRVECALEAIGMAQPMVGYWLFFETGQSLEGVIQSVAPVLCIAVFVLGLSTVAGAGACGAVGMLGGPGLAAEFASLGARGGFREGMALLEWLGIGAMAVYLADNIDRSLNLAIRGARRAWHAPDQGDEHFEINEVRNGADDLAHSAAVLLRLLLEGLVAGLLAEGASAAAARLPKFMQMLRESRLGKGFANWFEKNWKTLVEDPRFRPKPRPPEGGAGKGGGLGADGEAAAASPKKISRKSAVSRESTGKSAGRASETSAPTTPVPKASPKTEVSPQKAQKILYGARNEKGRLIGAHSPRVLDHPDFSADAVSANPDGTINAEVLKQDPDGSLSNVKESTLAPPSWSDKKIISVTRQVGDTPAVGTRSSDGATAYKGNVDGVNWLTIKDASGQVIAGYPNPSGATPGGFK
jgi:hypothetical protein